MIVGSTPFDGRANMMANVEDMKPSLISEFLYAVGSDLNQGSLSRPVFEVAMDMKLIGGPSEMRKPLNAGLIFFNERPDRFFPYARIEVVDKPDPTGIGMAEKIFEGPHDRQLKEALSYIRNYIIKEKVTKISGQAEAERIYNIPCDAVEEALSNAVYHKSYQIGEPITVMMMPEKMEITSLPGPDRTITDGDLANRRLASRRYRNRRIGDFLKELKLVEGRNTGIPTILRAMERNGSPLPIFETDPERTCFTVTLPVQRSFLSSGVDTKKPQKRTRRTHEEIKELIDKELGGSGDMSTNELAMRLGYKKVTEAFSASVKELMDDVVVGYANPGASQKAASKRHVF